MGLYPVRGMHRGGGSEKGFDLYQVHIVYPKIITIKQDRWCISGATAPAPSQAEVQHTQAIRKAVSIEPCGPVSHPWLSTG